ncbi:lycopene cyclase family protein [Kutzneria viridogrisea]|uniref:Lycopene beta-cyclase n=1 Tax=Kutzneria viridogrisea TaxID=47990 RepID=A0ABR6BYD2_9PSEU|nr:lycopene beta-cyclase [Kutzneria viridogrisea]
MLDVLVVGAGPAGLALAASCARVGLATAVVDRAPQRPWRATYGAWADELPALPDTAIAARASRVRAVALTEHVLPREYVVLDNAGLRAHLAHPEVDLRTGRVVAVRPGEVELADGTRMPAHTVVDASGAPAARGAAEQTAVGVVLPESCGVLAPGEAVFMDWRQVAPGEPTFCYTLPLGGGEVLVEETSLARRPGLPLPVLRERLAARLAAAGLSAGGREELVRFPLDVPRPRGRLAFGAAAGMVHPASGYSVATALGAAPSVAEAIAVTNSPVRRNIWPLRAKMVHALRLRGLAVLLRLPARDVPLFFELFFTLPPGLQRAYLSGRTDPSGTTAAMLALWRAAPWRLRGVIARAATTR